MFKVITVLKYKLKILFSDKSFLIAMTVIPLFLTLITGYALRFEKYNEIPVAICDLDNTDYSNMILERVKEKKGFKILPTDENKAIKLVKDYKVESAFIIKEGFKENILSGETKGIIEQIAHPSSISQEIIKEIIGSEVARIMLNTDAADWVINEYIKLNKLPSETQSDEKGQIWNEAWEHTDSLWEPEPPMKLEFEEVHEGTIGTVESEKNTFQDSTISSSAFGMLIAFIMFLIMFNSSWLVDEKENGTLKRIISGPGALTALFAGNILSLLIIGILQVVLFSTICSIFFGVDIFTRTSSIIIIFIYLLCVIGISLFVSSILKTRIQLQTGAPLFSIITGFIGGCFWNFTDMGGIMKTISLFTPQGLALDLFSRYGQQISDKTIPAVTGTILTTTSAIILLALAIGLTLVSYVSIKRLRY